MKKSILPLALLLFTGCIYGQQSFTNTGDLQFFNGANVTGFGDFINTSGAGFVNNGILYIKGNITNNQASMANSSGTLNLNGSAVQTVNGTQALRTYNLTTNNAAGFILNNNLNVGGVHIFSAGIITAAAPNYLVYEAGSSYSGSSDSRHVNGWVSKTGATNFSFPVGNGTYLRSITVNNLSASSVFNAKYSGATTNTSNLDASLISVDQYEYWTLNQVSGGTAQVTLNWDNSKIPFPPYTLAGVRVARYSAGLWTSRGGSAIGNVASTGSITSNSLNSFGAFTFGSMSAILPLRYIDLTAKRNDDYTLLKWKTEQEINVDHFEIERKDGSIFVNIGSVRSENSLLPHYYTYEDHKYLNGIVHYRIKSIDIDGQAFYSNIVSVSDRMRSGSYTIINPVVSTIYLQVDDTYKGAYQYEIISSSGQLIQTGHLNIESAGSITIALNSGVLAGHYVLRIKNSLKQITEQIIVK